MYPTTSVDHTPQLVKLHYTVTFQILHCIVTFVCDVTLYPCYNICFLYIFFLYFFFTTGIIVIIVDLLFNEMHSGRGLPRYVCHVEKYLCNPNFKKNVIIILLLLESRNFQNI